MFDATAAPRTTRMFGITLHPVTMQEAVRHILGWAAEPFTQTRYVVTPNVDHCVLFQRDETLRRAYAEASLVLADGLPVVLAGKLLGRRIPQRVAGSDVTPAIFTAAANHHRFETRPLRVFLLGAAPGVAGRAAKIIHARWKNVEVVGTLSPPLGFETLDTENTKIIHRVNEATPDVLVIGLGAPKQELWIHAHYRTLTAKVALCVGATIDFIAGHKRRAPAWMQHFGLEWLHRLSGDPGRLAKRYAQDAAVFPQLVWKEARGKFD